jgi:hypothetical protein
MGNSTKGSRIIRTLLIFSSLYLTVLGGCNVTPTPSLEPVTTTVAVVEPTSPTAPTLSHPRVIPTPFPSPHYEREIEPASSRANTAIFFLWDDSQSVLRTSSVEGKGCGGKNAAYRIRVPRFFANLFLETDTKNIQIGLGSIGNNFDLKHGIEFPSDDLINHEWEAWEAADITELERNTDYIGSLEGAEDNLIEAKETQRKILIVLTDGFLPNQSDSEKDDIIERFDNLAEQDVEIYVMLLCPTILENESSSDSDFWTERVASIANDKVHVMTDGNPTRWVKDLFSEIEPYFPEEYSGWVDSQQELKGWIAGDAESVSVLWLPFVDGQATLDIDTRIIDSLQYKHTISLALEQDCSPFTFEVSAVDKTAGFVLIKPDRPKLDLEIQDYQPILNNQIFTFTTVLKSTDFTKSEMADRAYCYRIDPVFDSIFFKNEQPPLRVDSCGSKSLCYDNSINSLYADWEWKPSRYEGPGSVLINVETSRTKIEQGTERFFKEIPIMFQSQFLEGEYADRIGPTQIPGATPLPGVQKGLLDEVIFTYTFEYDVGLPEIWLPSPGLDKLSQGSADLQQKSGSHYVDEDYLCPKPEKGDDRLWILRGEHLHSSPYIVYATYNDGANWQTGYVVRMSRYILTVCGYNTLIFHWPDNDHVLETIYTCLLNISNATDSGCYESTNK